MKTLKLFTISFLLFAVVAVASAREAKSTMIFSSEDLKNSFREMIENDFTESTGFLNQNNVSRLSENVEVIFLITPEKAVKILSTKSENQIASDYIMQLLDKKSINVSNELIGEKYHVNFKLSYKAF
jgi:hypothetical protein